jgi:hypothetical protein
LQKSARLKNSRALLGVTDYLLAEADSAATDETALSATDETSEEATSDVATEETSDEATSDDATEEATEDATEEAAVELDVLFVPQAASESAIASDKTAIIIFFIL